VWAERPWWLGVELTVKTFEIEGVLFCEEPVILFFLDQNIFLEISTLGMVFASLFYKILESIAEQVIVLEIFHDQVIFRVLALNQLNVKYFFMGYDVGIVKRDLQSQILFTGNVT
jgi:hypothetical protein